VGEGRSSGERLRYTVEDAAAVLGMTTGAVRNRLSQGTLQSVEEHGTVYILLPADTTRDDTARDTGDIPGESSALMSELRDRIAILERELEGKDAILLNIAEAVKDISPPAQEESARESREAPRDDGHGAAGKGRTS
jgi:hypothetical protein